MKRSELRSKLEALGIEESLETVSASLLGEMLIEAIEELENRKTRLRATAEAVEKIAQDVAAKMDDLLPTVDGLPQSWQEMLTLQSAVSELTAQLKSLIERWKAQA